MTDKIDDSTAYNAELEKLQKRYKEKLKGVLEDAREKYRFTISELILKELFESASRKKSKEAAAESDDSEIGGENATRKNETGKNLDGEPIKIEIAAEPSKTEIMKKTQEAVKAFAKTALTKVLIDYVKDVQTLNSAFGKANSGAKFSQSLDFDTLTDGLSPSDDFLSSSNVGKNADCAANEKTSEKVESDNGDDAKGDNAEPCGIFCPNNSKEIN